MEWLHNLKPKHKNIQKPHKLPQHSLTKIYMDNTIVDDFPEKANESTENRDLSTQEEMVTVREYDEKDKEKVDEMERKCEVGLVTDLLGDPLCRVRQFALRVMMVAEYGSEKEIVGVIRGCVKTVTSGKKLGELPIYVKVAYVLGLRVSPNHRRYGIATKLVYGLEEWCKKAGAKYVYMATDCNNKASINLFTHKCNYTKFRSLTALVQPVHAHYKPINSRIGIVRLPPPVATSIYRRVFHNTEFFPKDIDSILSNKFCLGTFIAVPKKYLKTWDPREGLPTCYAMLSVWNTKEMYKLQLQGASKLTKACCLGSRVLDACLPWLRLPSIPNLFRPFGFYFLFGLHMEGKGCLPLMKSLCHLAHNMARDDVACGAIVAEVARWDPIGESIPHWKSFSWEEDIWCIKKLVNDEKCEIIVGEHNESLDRMTSSLKTFVDPRDM